MTSDILSSEGVQVLYHRGKFQNNEAPKRRVAVYARVSTDLEEQTSSLETQMEAFKARIASHSDWELYSIYAEEGKSGTMAAKRPEFQRMIADCKAGKIDYILTKSISRFARNTVDCLNYVRELKDIGVFVYFDKEKIDSANSASEMLLSVLAAVAQEESRSISENVKWGMRKRFQEGKPKWTNTYGFKRDAEGNYTIEKAQAEVVHLIFDMYSDGYSLPEITDRLNVDGVPTYYGNKWWYKSVSEILKNEKYIGDIRMQKTYVTDHISHNKVKNDQTLLPGYYVRDHHTGIISRKQFELVQTILAMKNTHDGRTLYPYYGTLLCPFCGRKMTRFCLSGHGHLSAWTCLNEKCEPYAVREKYIDRMLLRAFDELGCDALSEMHTDASRSALIWKAKLKESDSFTRRIEYIFLDETVDSINFDGWDTGVVTWKCGLQSRTVIKYDRIADIPDAKVAIDGGVYSYSGGIVPNGKSVIACIQGAREDVTRLRESEKDNTERKDVPQ